jgi:hypothetical protein
MVVFQGILFFVVLYEDNTVNRMQESLNLFAEVVKNPLFKSTPIFVFLNKKDLFEEMIPKFPLKNCFPDYDGPEGKPYGVFWICIIILMMACLFDQDKFSLPCSSLNVNIAVLWKRTYPESRSTYL